MLIINKNNKLFKVINNFLIKNKTIVFQGIKMQTHIFKCACCVGVPLQINGLNHELDRHCTEYLPIYLNTYKIYYE